MIMCLSRSAASCQPPTRSTFSAGGRVDGVLLVALLARDGVVAASLELHELEQAPGHGGVGVGTDRERGRLTALEPDPVASRLP